MLKGILHLYDLDSDAIVDHSDRRNRYTLLTVDLRMDLDVNRRGWFDLNDIHTQNQAPLDVNCDGVVNATDLEDLTNT